MDHPEVPAHEAYSFACMRCGHGWEQEFEITHLEYPDGTPFVVYRTDGKRVPSPIKHPTCVNCDGHQLRIMRSGRVAAAQIPAAPAAAGPAPRAASRKRAGKAVPGESRP